MEFCTNFEFCTLLRGGRGVGNHIILEELIQYCGKSLVPFETSVNAEFLLLGQYIYPWIIQVGSAMTHFLT